MSTDPDALADFILSVADFHEWRRCWQPDSFQVWRLRKSLCGLPQGSIVTRAQLAQAHAASLTATIPAHSRPQSESAPVKSAGREAEGAETKGTAIP